jgi:Zn2+/Cd2+-exporting ATPase
MEEQKQKIKREFTLEGLDCANCAMKIENGVKGIAGVSAYSVNFATKTLTLETEQTKEETVVSEAKKKVKMLEPHINLQEKENHYSNLILKRIRLCILCCKNRTRSGTARGCYIIHC